MPLDTDLNSRVFLTFSVGKSSRPSYVEAVLIVRYWLPAHDRAVFTSTAHTKFKDFVA